MKIIEGQKYYTIFEVAETVGVHFQSVRRWITQGKLKAVKVSRNYYINAADVRKLVSGEPTEPKDKEPVETVKNSGKTYENLKAAILAVLENRESILDVDTLGVDTLNEGYEKTTRKIDKLFKKHLPKEIRENSNFDYAYMTIYDNAFKQGYKMGYYELLEDLKNLIKYDQLNMD